MNDEANQDSAPTSAGRVLVVDDERNIRSTLKMVLADLGYQIDLASDGDEAEKILAQTPPDVVMLDVRMPKRNGIELLRTWRQSHPHLPIILMSGEATLTEALDGLKAGAYDFIEKPFLEPRLINTLGRAMEKTRLEATVNSDEGNEEDRIIGQSPALRRVLNDVLKIAPTKSRVLITGESGTGKDLLARAIHRHSSRAKNRFTKVNCAAIPSELIESELFGHVKGAFTGAVAARRGVFESANGGTLFLDEIGELSPSAQAKILRALQNGEITPVGSDLTIKVDVRVVAATNRDLKAEVETGSFREDLYYRLAVVQIESPPLRSRLEDIPLLANHFSQQIRVENGLAEKRLTSEVVLALQSYIWPGNIRELRNVMERLMILGGPQIGLEDLPADIRSRSKGQTPSQSMANVTFQPQNWEEFKQSSERNYLIAVLKHCQANISEAARILQVERSTIHKWLKSHQIEKQHYLV